ncbi:MULTISPECIES: hypothetical protein [unclassified Paenibacillus]|uniref:hypothetical protein n=1 Tax=unclassified Paenibacillus TaxID=185978 RepID=UPI001AE27037|nr:MULTISPECIES: hypothetical protein [unclassified Paenibacillus]MBP1155883.1 hypothetical protein [Paenibacillus sp. PvP091]MBP1168731.1 hypothetical protein [Paenibacillus sp. PvR098]MBP2439759.1 hypothetical protein [Paenibacillus sp. PvP052]
MTKQRFKDVSPGVPCPESSTISVPDTLDCSCPRPITTRRFPSPNSPLRPKDLERLKESIEAANELLRTLGNPREPDNLRELQLHFRTLRGVMVRISVDCTDAVIHLVGRVEDAGRDFLQINAVGQQVFVLYDRICLIHQEECKDSIVDTQELRDADACLRRDLVLHFGSFVSGNPYLMNLFFGLPLHWYLLQFVCCEVVVHKVGEEGPIRGILVGSDKEQVIQIQKGNKLEQIKCSEICYLTI